MSLLRRKIGNTVLLILFAPLFLSAQVSDREYQIKAAFLFNFTQFVEWPDNFFPTAQSPAIIGILGTDPFGNYLKDMITGESIDHHPLVIKHFSSIEEVTNCNILFINVTNKKNIQDIIEKLKGKGILTVSDANRFSKLGGMIQLSTKDDKVDIEINLEAIKEENLTVSSKLLKLSQIVATDRK
jgi:hypothetical protein